MVDMIAKITILEHKIERIIPAGKAATKVRALKTPYSEEYAEAILDRNTFGFDTAEVYFYRFAPKGSPNPTDTAYHMVMDDPVKKATYDKECYCGWVTEIQQVQKIVDKYDGQIEAYSIPLKDYIAEVERSGKIPEFRIRVRISIPGQLQLRSLRKSKRYLQSLGN